MTNSISNGRPGEFELIRNFFAPLSGNIAGAFGLTDDVAVLTAPEGHDIVVKTDAIVEGVHFHRSDPPGTIAKKALRVNISDFAAKGARPGAWLLALALPDWPDTSWFERFVRGLAEDQEVFAVALAGGDTVRTSGMLTIVVTMTGFVPDGAVIRRAGAAAGDIVYVTGTIGDAGGGFDLIQASARRHTAWQEELISRYLIPRPRLAFGQALRGLASAALDVSDGLIADLGHLADVSRVRVEIAAESIPLSPALRQLYGDDLASIMRAATAGDDYEIAFTAPPAKSSAIAKAALQTKTDVTAVGRVVAGAGAVMLDAQGREVTFIHKGYTHF